MNTSPSELERLVERARTADPDAWEAIYRRAYPRLFAYARRWLTTDGDAEDAVSETIARAMQRIDSFVWSSAGIDGWLFGIARNVLLETYRADARTRTTDPSVLSEPSAEGLRPHGAPAASVDPAVQVVRLAEHDIVRRAFARLTAPERELLELRVVSGLGAHAVATVTGQRPGTVRMAQSRALQRLRAEYEELSR